jgi:hypothetical protein
VTLLQCQNIKTREKNNFKICEKVVYDICMIKQKFKKRKRKFELKTQQSKIARLAARGL